ncbi:MAG: HAMP domain-containing histidine kinase [candidate division Zixibacteria bacterium]|nr:HAMP domain-containing histidine kinase [candidate division Zixibacteria bacterium]MDH3938328.1 HAMP domain-containing histidine kinase [candidate division Zixibacteria bacterium]MDH4033682.1 HAMP domain-containing histidine kinase [candidate division Zixibacteria bacterium]
MTSKTDQVEHKPESNDAVEQIEADKWLEFVSVLLHDMESPLASMKYLLKLLDEKKLNLAKPLHRQIVASSHIAMERTESIIYDIMAVAKAGKMGIPCNPVPLDVLPVVREAIVLVQGSAQEHKIDMRLTGNLSEQIVKADTGLLKRVLDNLLFNAVRHTPENGEIVISIDEQADSVYIHIKDSGPGLGDVDPEVLFEKYGQLKLRTEGRHRGVGLGLYFCKLAAMGMGGTILADDHPEGGAVFSTKLRKAKGGG